MSGYPFVFMIMAGQFVYLIWTLLCLLLFFGLLFRYKCSRCINFFCLFNSVPKVTVDHYLEKNPVMWKAWQETGRLIEKKNISP